MTESNQYDFPVKYRAEHRKIEFDSMSMRKRIYVYEATRLDFYDDRGRWLFGTMSDFCYDPRVVTAGQARADNVKRMLLVIKDSFIDLFEDYLRKEHCTDDGK